MQQIDILGKIKFCKKHVLDFTIGVWININHMDRIHLTIAVKSYDILKEGEEINSISLILI